MWTRYGFLQAVTYNIPLNVCVYICKPFYLSDQCFINLDNSTCSLLTGRCAWIIFATSSIFAQVAGARSMILPATTTQRRRYTNYREGCTDDPKPRWGNRHNQLFVALKVPDKCLPHERDRNEESQWMSNLFFLILRNLSVSPIVISVWLLIACLFKVNWGYNATSPPGVMKIMSAEAGAWDITSRIP